MIGIPVVIILAVTPTLLDLRERKHTAQEVLGDAVYNEDVETVRLAVRLGADVNDPACLPGSQSPLTFTCLKGRTNSEKMVRALIELGSDVNRQDASGNLALNNAAMRGRPELVKMLLENGANVHAFDRHGDDALFWASVSTNAEEMLAIMELHTNRD